MALFKWIEDRTRIGKILKMALYEPVPGGARWRYVWGSTLTFAIFVQFVTGIVLWANYSPSSQTAWWRTYGRTARPSITACSKKSRRGATA